MKSGHGAPSFIQLDLEDLQGWRQHSLFEQPALVSTHPQGKKCVFVSSLDLSSFS